MQRQIPLPSDESPRVALFVTCLVDLFRPNVGFAAIRLLEQVGCVVEVPRLQACCGQPAHNSGDVEGARAIARQVIEAFEGYDYVVAPSGSCTGMLAQHYPDLFDGDPRWRARAEAFSARCHELLVFLADHIDLERLDTSHEARVTYHDSCSGLRELNIRAQPRKLLEKVHGLELVEMADTQVCCGFGGTFCVKYPEISERLVSDKVRNIEASGADTLLGGDLGCLLNIAGRLKRLGRPVRVFHTAEVLAGFTDEPAIAEDS